MFRLCNAGFVCIYNLEFSHCGMFLFCPETDIYNPVAASSSLRCLYILHSHSSELSFLASGSASTFVLYLAGCST